MINNFTKIFTVAILALLMTVECFASGGKRNGTAGAQELLIPVGARGLALNGAYISGISGIDAIYYNPAGLGRAVGKTEALFTYMNWIGDIGVSYAAVSTSFAGLGALGISVKSLDFGDIPETTRENPYGTGSTFSPSFVTFTLTYSNSLTDRISVGLNANLVTEKIISTSASGFSFDFGVQYNGIADVEGLQLGVVLKNFGPQFRFDGADLIRKATDPESNRGEQFYKIESSAFELPSQLQLGVAYERRFADDYKVVFATSFQNNNFSNDEYIGAAEFAYQDMFFVRGGYSYMSEAIDVEEEQVFGPTFGAGVVLRTGIDLHVDYAYRYARYFDANHMFTVKFSF